MVATKETLKPNERAGWAAAAISLVAAVAAYFGVGGFPALTSTEGVIAFGAWLMKFGLVLAVVGFIFATAAAFATAMGTTTKTSAAQEAALEGVEEAAASPMTGSALLKDLIGVTGTLVAQPAGVGAFIMLVGTILVVGVAFAD